MSNPAGTDDPLALIASITDGLPVALWVARVPDGAFVYANRMFGEIMGVQGGLDGVAVGGYTEPYGIHGLDGALYPENRLPFVQVLQQRAAITLDDIVIHRPDGNRRNVRAIGTPLYGPDGEMAYVAITFTDITREVEAERGRAESEARLFHAQKMESIGNLASGVAHDFNNLLASIKILASLLRMDERDPLKIENLDRIDQSAESALRLTRSLLGFARSGSDTLGRIASVNRCVEEVVNVFTRTVDPRIVITSRLETAASNVPGDSSRLEQVLFNLLINARDALPEGGTVVVRTAETTLDEAAVRSRPPLVPGKHVLLEVSDDGPGIAPGIRSRIFEPYFTTKTEGPIRGTGLGLAMVYGIVQAHGGWIEAVSGVPRGTTMRILLPQAADQQTAVPASATSRAVAAGRGHVLLVEDEPDVRRAAALALQKIGYEVTEAEDGVEAVAAFRARPEAFSLVLLDMAMPRLNGRDAYAQMRAIRPDVLVVLSSGSALNDDARALLAQGARAFLEKPYDVKTLSETLANVRR